MYTVNYEDKSILNEYLLFHYGEKEEVLPYPFGPIDALEFPIRCITELLDSSTLPEQPHALDLGCAVGRSSFELARYCDSVMGIDYSQIFISAAQTLQKEGSLNYTKKITGTITKLLTAKVAENINRSRVQFSVGDAHELPQDLGCFDVVLAANLLCRMNDPKKLLKRLPSLIKPNGQLILTTPSTWLETITPMTNWLGATPETGEPLAIIQTILSPNFELITAKDIPFLIGEHSRKFQWSVAQGSVWKRK